MWPLRVIFESWISIIAKPILRIKRHLEFDGIDGGATPLDALAVRPG